MPWLRIELATFWFAGWHSIHWATPARVSFSLCFSPSHPFYLSLYLLSSDFSFYISENLVFLCFWLTNGDIPQCSILCFFFSVCLCTNIPFSSIIQISPFRRCQVSWVCLIFPALDYLSTWMLKSNQHNLHSYLFKFSMIFLIKKLEGLLFLFFLWPCPCATTWQFNWSLFYDISFSNFFPCTETQNHSGSLSLHPASNITIVS